MNYFIDCGFYVGKALEYYSPFIDENWKVIVFEPNEDLNLKSTLKSFPFDIELRNEAVWTEDTSLSFTLSGREDAASITDINGQAPVGTKTVKAIDFSKFIADLPEDSTIVCSMDIEGAEFPVLEKMLKDGTMSRISLIDIEFHQRILEDRTDEDAQRLIRQMQGANTLVKVKIPVGVE